MKNVCFSVVHHKTPLFFEIGKQLEIKGYKVYYMSGSPKWTRWLIENGISSNRVHEQLNHKTKDGLELPNLVSDAFKTEFSSGQTINSIILNDRILKYWDYDEAKLFLLTVHRETQNFMTQNKIDFVVGEPTGALDLLISGLCDRIGVRYIFPHTIRIPDGRYAFFEGRHQKQYISVAEKRKSEDSECKMAREYLASFVTRKPKPEYFKKNNKKKNISSTWIGAFFRTLMDEVRIGRLDGTRFGLFWLIRQRLREVFNTKLFELIKLKTIEDLGDADIIFPLHKQPESSIDVLAEGYNDQLFLIKSIAQSLPIGYRLVVKEHSNAIGDRSLSFYRELLRVPNVCLMSPMVDSFDLLKKAKLIITVSGTMAYEAGLLDIPAITFAKMFFNDLPSIKYCHSVKDLAMLITRQLNYKSNEHTRKIQENFVINLMRNSFDGNVLDSLNYPENLDPKNIEKVSESLDKLMSIEF